MYITVRIPTMLNYAIQQLTFERECIRKSVYSFIFVTGIVHTVMLYVLLILNVPSPSHQ